MAQLKCYIIEVHGEARIKRMRFVDCDPFRGIYMCVCGYVLDHYRAQHLFRLTLLPHPGESNKKTSLIGKCLVSLLCLWSRIENVFVLHRTDDSVLYQSYGNNSVWYFLLWDTKRKCSIAQFGNETDRIDSAHTKCVHLVTIINT